MGPQCYTSRSVSGTLNPKWNFNCQFFINDVYQDVLCITVFEKGQFSPDGQRIRRQRWSHPPSCPNPVFNTGSFLSLPRLPGSHQGPRGDDKERDGGQRRRQPPLPAARGGHGGSLRQTRPAAVRQIVKTETKHKHTRAQDTLANHCIL